MSILYDSSGFLVISRRPQSSACLRFLGLLLIGIMSLRPHGLVSAIRCCRTSPQVHHQYHRYPQEGITALAFHTIYTKSQSTVHSSPFHRTHERISRVNKAVLPQTCCSSSSSNKAYSIQENNKNEKLAQLRLNQIKEKQQARQSSKLELHNRHLKTKSLLASDPTLSKNLIAIKVIVDMTLRSELKMNGREKRGRIFVLPQSEACTTIQGLKNELHAFFRCLKKSTFTLRAGLPQVSEDEGSIASPDEEDDREEEGHLDTFQHFWSMETDQDVIDTFVKAYEFYHQNSHKEDDDEDAVPAPRTSLKRPSIVLRVEKDMHAPPPPPLPSYLENMPDPALTETMTMLSFYAFPPMGVENPENFSLMLRKAWKPFGALGRVYVAHEGINAQMSIPTNVLEHFRACCRSIPELGSYMENGLNIDPIPLSMEEFAFAGDMNGKPAPPFRSLHVRVRDQVVADGLDSPLNWQSAGYDMPPLEWHDKLLQAQKATTATTAELGEKEEESSLPIILDCRNKYETNVGRFVLAEPLETEIFRETWDALKERLKDTPKDAPIMTYCTGGIRCVKVGAYLTQEMGFTNVARLAGGIVSYDRAIHSQETGVTESMFKGTNYVFDGRVGRQITEDALAECITCAEKTSLISNCNNENCHKRITQCQVCRSSFMGTCSDACKIRVLNSGLRPTAGVESTFFSTQQDSSKDSLSFQSLDEYSSAHSSSPPSIYDEILENTKAFFPSGAHMASGAQQGRLLTSLASMTREGRILELGTFTGYATACFLEGAAIVGDILNDSYRGDSQKGPFVLSLERDVRAFTLAARHLQALSKHEMGNDCANELSRIREMELEDIEMDSFTFKYKNAGCEITRVNDALAFVEALSIQDSTMYSPFDLIFIDADKTRLLEYVEVCLKNDKVLKKGGIIIVDNVLWKGGVIGQGQSPIGADDDNSALSMKTDAEIKKSRRARKMANVMHQFNTNIVKDNRVEVVILPLRDGLSLIRKKI